MPKEISTAILDLESGYLEESGSTIQVDTKDFQNWLRSNNSFRVNAGEDSYRARKESYTGTDYWYGVKKVAGKLHKKFIGKTNELTSDRLREVANSIRQPSAKISATVTTPAPEEDLTRIDLFEATVKTLQQQVNTLQSQVDTLQQQLSMLLLEHEGKLAA